MREAKEILEAISKVCKKQEVNETMGASLDEYSENELEELYEESELTQKQLAEARDLMFEVERFLNRHNMANTLSEEEFLDIKQQLQSMQKECDKFIQKINQHFFVPANNKLANLQEQE